MSSPSVERSFADIRRRLGVLEARDKGIGNPRLFAARYSTAVAQQFTNSATIIVNYGTQTYDLGGRVTTGASWAYTCVRAGLYNVTASILFAATTEWGLGEAGSLLLYKNGVRYSTLDRNDSMNSAATAQFKMLHGTDDLVLAVGDVLDIRAAQTSGAAAGFLALHTDPAFNFVAIKIVG